LGLRDDRTRAFLAILAAVSDYGIGPGTNSTAALETFRSGYVAASPTCRQIADEALDAIGPIGQVQRGGDALKDMLRIELGGRSELGPQGRALLHVVALATGVLVEDGRVPVREQIAVAAGWW